MTHTCHTTHLAPLQYYGVLLLDLLTSLTTFSQLLMRQHTLIFQETGDLSQVPANPARKFFFHSQNISLSSQFTFQWTGFAIQYVYSARNRLHLLQVCETLVEISWSMTSDVTKVGLKIEFNSANPRQLLDGYLKHTL